MPRPIRLSAPGAGTGTGAAKAGMLATNAAERRTHLFIFAHSKFLPAGLSAILLSILYAKK